MEFQRELHRKMDRVLSLFRQTKTLAAGGPKAMRHTNKDAPIHTMQTVVDRARRTRLGERAPRLETVHNETRGEDRRR